MIGPPRVPKPPEMTIKGITTFKDISKAEVGEIKLIKYAVKAPAMPTKTAEITKAISLEDPTLIPRPRARASSSRIARRLSPYFDWRIHQETLRASRSSTRAE